MGWPRKLGVTARERRCAPAPGRTSEDVSAGASSTEPVRSAGRSDPVPPPCLPDHLRAWREQERLSLAAAARRLGVNGCPCGGPRHGGLLSSAGARGARRRRVRASVTGASRGLGPSGPHRRADRPTESFRVVRRRARAPAPCFRTGGTSVGDGTDAGTGWRPRPAGTPARVTGGTLARLRLAEPAVEERARASRPAA